MGGPMHCKEVSKEIAYNVKIFIDESECNDQMFSMEKVTNGTFKTIFPEPNSKPEGRSRRSIDLLGIGADLRLVIEDNTAKGDPDNGVGSNSRDDFYRNNNLTSIYKFNVPLHVEVTKFVANCNNQTEAVKDDEIAVVFKLIDPPEDTKHITGPKHIGVESPVTGKSFVEKINSEIKARQKKLKPEVVDDNCIEEFSSTLCGGRCRQFGERIKASNILKCKSNELITYDMSPNQNQARVKIKASNKSGHMEGLATVLFSPPLILGDNYILEITVTDQKGKSMVLKDEKQKEIKCFQSPKITIWKKLKIDKVVHQYSVDCDDIKWNEITNAFRDAFIVVEEPPKSHRVPVSLQEWMNQLGQLTVYSLSHRKKDEWENYVKAPKTFHEEDFKSFSFPQHHPEIEGTKNITPKDEATERAPNLSTGDLITELTKQIIKAKLDANFRHIPDVAWNNFTNPLKAKRIGFYLFICKPPSADSNILGGFFGGKIIFAYHGKADITHSVVHEMGHALFLNHGVTSIFLGTTNAKSKVIDAPIVMRADKPGSTGPYFYEHDSDDMIGCVMSYSSDFYDGKGSKLNDTETDPFKKRDHPVDWHFCGVCLLKLRFYKPTRMQTTTNSSIFRELQYSKKPLKIAFQQLIGEQTYFKEYIPLTGDPMKDLENQGKADMAYEISDSDSLTLQENLTTLIFVLYPKEGNGIRNNRNFEPYKDLSFLSEQSIPSNSFKGRWDPFPEDAEFKCSIRVNPLTRNNEIRYSYVYGKIRSVNEYTFRIKVHDGVERSSNPLMVKVEPGVGLLSREK